MHLGRNAIDALVDALGSVRGFKVLEFFLPAAVEHTIAEAKAVSEAESGEGEAETLRRITVNTGASRGASASTPSSPMRERCATFAFRRG